MHCTICNIESESSLEHQQHLSSTLHQQNVQLLALLVEKARTLAKQYKEALYSISQPSAKKLDPPLTFGAFKERIGVMEETSTIVENLFLAHCLKQGYASRRPCKFVKKRRRLLIGFMRELLRLCVVVGKEEQKTVRSFEQIKETIRQTALDLNNHTPLDKDTNLALYGSVALELDTDTSDIDLSANVSERTLLWIHTTMDHLRSPLLKSELCLSARTPLVTLHDTLYHLQLDLAQSMDDKLFNCRMIQECLKREPNLRYAVFGVKAFAKSEGLNCSFSGTVNSYGWTVLLLAFLQHEGILPLLVGETMHFESKRTPQISDERLGALYRGFFAYYSEFNFGERRISLRHESGSTNKELHKFGDNAVLCIERPFDAYSNNARQVTSKTLKVIQRKFHEMTAKLANISEESCVVV